MFTLSKTACLVPRQWEVPLSVHKAKLVGRPFAQSHKPFASLEFVGGLRAGVTEISTRHGKLMHSATLQGRLKTEGKRADVLQQRTGSLFKKLDELSKRRGDALESLNKKKMELEVRTNDIESLKDDIKRLKENLILKEQRNAQLTEVLSNAADKFVVLSSTIRDTTRTATTRDRRSTGHLHSAQLAASRGYRCTENNTY